MVQDSGTSHTCVLSRGSLTPTGLYVLNPVSFWCADYSAASAVSVSNTTGTGVFILLLLNLVIFVLDHQLHLPQIQRLYLDHIAPKWWQFITSSFCHASWAHLSSNTFLLYVFGKIVEEEEGLWGVWFTYIITAVGECGHHIAYSRACARLLMLAITSRDAAC